MPGESVARISGQTERRGDRHGARVYDGQVPLVVANLPGATFDGATGRYMFGQLCLAAQLQRDLESERMTGMQRRLFEEGRHRGHDPFGCRSLRDKSGRLVRPRQLVIVPEEAAVVRRVWRELAGRSIAEVADVLNRELVTPRGSLCTRDAVKDILRRGASTSAASSRSAGATSGRAFMSRS